MVWPCRRRAGTRSSRMQGTRPQQQQLPAEPERHLNQRAGGATRWLAGAGNPSDPSVLCYPRQPDMRAWDSRRLTTGDWRGSDDIPGKGPAN